MQTIGIIGQGFVGTAVREGMRHAFDVMTYDKKEPNLLRRFDANGGSSSAGDYDDPLLELLYKVDGPIFLCLPTPMRPDGSCDTRIVEGVIEQVADYVLYHNANSELHGDEPLDCIMVLKSTVPPGFTDKMNQKFPNVSVVFNPEFLTEANAARDFRNQNRIILGRSEGDNYSAAMGTVHQMYSTAYPWVPQVVMRAKEAELVKYFTNCALACRVSLANEFCLVAEALGVDYKTVIDAVKLDRRVGATHWDVPGPDGKRGFGGSCFPKDLNGLRKVAEDLGVYARNLWAAWKTNLDVRPERDWENLVGRAVSAEPEKMIRPPVCAVEE